jgi:hypothetical protein
MNEKLEISHKKEKIRSLCRTLGYLSGTLDSVVCRIYPLKKKNGKIVYQQRFASLPVKYRVNNRKDMVENRNRFRTNNIFAGYINKIPELKEIWEKYADKKKYFSAYTAITKENSPFTGISAPGEMNLILPPTKTCIILKKSNIKLSKESIQIGSIPEGKIIVVLSLINPKSSKSKKFQLFTLKGESKEGVADLKISDKLSEGLKKYKKYIIYLTILNENKTTNYSPLKIRIKITPFSANRKSEISEMIVIKLYPTVDKIKEAISHSPPLAA